ncbi:methyltransferase domain-containing protein [Desulfovibrio sp. OttesenSCG-928-I05]|nr:methyltransferase domain-containing protein [Desulfovibrio sp. OttesenSCG-928-I05]
MSLTAQYLFKLFKMPDFFGVNRYCNICGFRFAKFATTGLIPREARCPVCESLERHRHLYIHLLPLLPFLKGKRVLHFAPEKIIKDFFTHSDAEYFDVDIEKGRASYQIDITRIDFEDNFFDYCIAIHVLEHIVDDAKAFSELYRVLKPGGTAFLAVPAERKAFEDYSVVAPIDRLKTFGQGDHVRIYSQDLFEERILAAGFTVQTSTPSAFPDEMREACKLGDVITLAKK